jgi:UDP-N-acetyl-D-galactosamine dehydrogenase
LFRGLTFKENCPDLRNTRVVDIINELQTYGVNVHVYDPWVDPEEAYKEYGIKPIATLEEGRFDAILLAVAQRGPRRYNVHLLNQDEKARNSIWFPPPLRLLLLLLGKPLIRK